MSSSNLLDRDFELLLEIAHIAISLDLLEPARELLLGLTPERPANAHPRIGQAMVAHVSGDRTGAIAILEGVLSDFPSAVFTRSLLARFLKESGLPGWQPLAEQALVMSQEGVVADMAREVLGRTATTGEARESPLSRSSLPQGFRGTRV